MLLKRVRADKRVRVTMAMGSLALAVGLVLKTLVHPDGQIAKDWLDGICGLLIGVSLGLNLFGLMRARRCAESRREAL
jgi:hypothetical protein